MPYECLLLKLEAFGFTGKLLSCFGDFVFSVWLSMDLILVG